MTLPGGEANLTIPGLPDILFPKSGPASTATLSGAYDLVQSFVEDALKQFYVLDNPAINNPLAEIFAGLRAGISLPLAIIEAIVNRLLPWLPDIEFPDLDAALQQLADFFTDLFAAFGGSTGLPQLQNFLANLLSLFDNPILTGSPGVFDVQAIWDNIAASFLAAVTSAIDQALRDILGGSVGALLTDIEDRFANLNLAGLFDASALANIANIPMIAQSRISGLLTALASATDLADVADAIFEAITGLPRGAGDPITDLNDVLRSIPFLNILGIGGPANLGDSIQSTWDNLIGGLVGAIGIDAGLADLFNISREVSSRATLGLLSWDIIGIRNNRSLNSGFFPSTRSNIGLDAVALEATAPLLAITETTALTQYERINENLSVGVVSWQGLGAVNITDFRINVYRMNTSTGVNDRLHSSTNQNGLLSATMAQVAYSLPTPVEFAATEIIAIERVVRGSGTHSVAGKTTWLPDQLVFPRRYGSRRDSSTTLAPSSFTPTYSTDVGFIEFGVSAGDIPLFHTPATEPFNTAGSASLPIPVWANFVEVIALGGGGGGRGGGVGFNGEGGHAGAWATATWERGTHFTGTSTTISITVGAGGAGGSGNGASGASSIVSITGQTVTAVGGAGGTGGLFSDEHGQSPGNQSFGGQPYVGGGQQNSLGGPGAPPGGGGAGGSGILLSNGGTGAIGAVWIRFRQT